MASLYPRTPWPCFKGGGTREHVNAKMPLPAIPPGSGANDAVETAIAGLCWLTVPSFFY